MDRPEWMNDDQWYAAQFLCDLFRGWHHIGGKIEAAGPKGVRVNTRNTSGFSTFDFDMMTRGVVMAHDRCVRFSVGPSGPGMLKLFAHRREGREGPMCKRHPTLEDAIGKVRYG